MSQTITTEEFEKNWKSHYQRDYYKKNPEKFYSKKRKTQKLKKIINIEKITKELDDINDNREDNYIIYSINMGEQLASLGKILTVPYARGILKLTQNKTLSMTQIACTLQNKKDPKLPNTTYHKKRLESIGLTTFTTLPSQSQYGNPIKYYQSKKLIIIGTDEIVKKINDNVILKELLEKVSK